MILILPLLEFVLCYPVLAIRPLVLLEVWSSRSPRRDRYAGDDLISWLPSPFDDRDSILGAAGLPFLYSINIRICDRKPYYLVSAKCDICGLEMQIIIIERNDLSFFSLAIDDVLEGAVCVLGSSVTIGNFSARSEY